MANWRTLVADAAREAAVTVEDHLDALRFDLRRRLGRVGPVQVLPYRGHGTQEALYLTGRVLKDKGLSAANDHDRMWDNLVQTYRRFDSDEVPGARVRARYGRSTVEVEADHEGYFSIRLVPDRPLPDDRVWHDLQLELVEAPGVHMPVTATGSVLVPPAGCTFGVVSDIDDTVLQTHATDLLLMAQLTFLHNARTRLPFQGVAAFYRALQQGPRGSGHHPVFYVSSSPWNLYDFLIDFCDVHGIPIGPLFLRDLGLERHTQIGGRHHAHKSKQIEHILSTHPDLPFILVGDSGQHDPEIYHDAVHAHPGRIAAIYIRDVSPPPRDAEVQGIAERVRAAGVEMLLVRDTSAAARHAVEQGFITPAALPQVEAEKAKDAAGPSDLEQRLGLDGPS